MNFERSPKLPTEELARIVTDSQISYGDKLITSTLADSLEEWGRKHPGTYFTCGGSNPEPARSTAST